MKTIKLPRKLKKACKKAVVSKFPNWDVSEIQICNVSRLPRFVNRKSAIKVGGLAVTAYNMG